MLTERNRLIGNEVSIKQERWEVVPTFQSLEVLGEARPFLKETLATSPKSERMVGIRFSVSSLEKLIPHFLEKDGRVPKLKQNVGKKYSERLTAEGARLHQADLLFNLVIQGHTGVACELSLPTAKKDELEIYQKATDGIVLDGDAKESQIRDALAVAWERYYPLVRLGDADVPLPGFDMFDPRKEAAAYYSKELYRYGLNLAALWARESSRDRNEMWEFRRDMFTERELGATLVPADYPVVINTRFDFISRPYPSDSRVVTQIGDLKTGKPWDRSDLLGEVMKRQAQVMLAMAERYTVDGLANKKNIIKKGRNYILPTMLDNWAVVGRSTFVYRIFDKKDGSIRRIHVTMDKTRRKEFLRWFDWLVGKMFEDPDETRRVIKSSRNYELRGVPISVGGR